MCLDASEMRGRECHMDHQLLQVKLRVRESNLPRKPQQRGERYNVGLLCESKQKDSCSDSKKTEFQEELGRRVRGLWPQDGTVEGHKRDVLKESAATVLGLENRKQPDWFRESANTIEPALKK